MDMEKMKEIAGFLREQGYPVRMNEQFRAKAIASGRGEAVKRIEAKRARMLAYAEFLERVVEVEECNE